MTNSCRRLIGDWPGVGILAGSGMTMVFLKWELRWNRDLSHCLCGNSLTFHWRINTDTWQSTGDRREAKKNPLKNKARCNAVFLCSFWACDSCSGVDLYPSYTQRAPELDGALKWSRKALENWPSKAHFNWKAFPFSCHSFSSWQSYYGTNLLWLRRRWDIWAETHSPDHLRHKELCCRSLFACSRSAKWPEAPYLHWRVSNVNGTVFLHRHCPPSPRHSRAPL